MRRQKQKTKRNKGRNSTVSAGTEKPPAAQRPGSGFSRRDLFKRIGSGALVTAAVGGVGWYFVAEVMATIREDDLGRIGNGTPTIVQIHDPQCSACVALQREVRKALAEFDDEELQYVVANIRTAKGGRLAREHGVGNVTLLLFDGEGRRRDTLAGPSTSDVLAHLFRRHLARNGS